MGTKDTHGISLLQHSQNDVTMSLLESHISISFFFLKNLIVSSQHKLSHQNVSECLCSFLPKLTLGRIKCMLIRMQVISEFRKVPFFFSLY